MVDYYAKGPNWTLSIGDDGIGMPDESANAPTGLGTSIVEALARQLKANVRITDAKPGTLVSIAHNQIAAVGDATRRVL
jgi:two-component system, sensor histidine kinase PdtaS